ncbi:MAG: adenylate/guanylate cyclase domain-containing protein [Luminiphilus sp.]|nr:adenylate/guanylate cyclase domain-containing protein [Luminiphilus sp.]
MSIKARIILLSLFGNIAIGAIFFALSDYQDSQKETSSIESSATIYGQAWRTVLNDTFSSSLGLFHPQSGDPDKAALWAEAVDIDGKFFDLPVAVTTVLGRETIADSLDVLLEEAFIWGELSFAMVFDEKGNSLYCGTAAEGYGVDPCEESARPDFISTSTSRLKTGRAEEFSLGAVRSVSTIRDDAGELAAGFYQTLLIDLNNAQKKVGSVLLGKNLAEAIEIFEYDFSVKAVLGSSGYTVDLNDYFEAEDYAELGEIDPVVEPLEALLDENLLSMQEKGYWGELNRDLGVSYVAIALSDFAKIEDGKLVVVSNKRESVSKQVVADQYAFGVFAAVFLLILGAITWLTSYSFGGISKAIGVLSALTRGQLDVAMPKPGFLHSERDEVGQLNTSLETYKGHLIEMESIRATQSQKRQQRDKVVLDKMASLSSQLKGDAKKLLEADIDRMKSLTETDDFDKAEEASAELMSIAVSRMSDEVVALIEARTGEIKSALDRNEELLLNILPKSIADRKLADEKVIADAHESCSILFGDIVGFTQLSKDLGAERLVEFLDEVFTAFDDFSDELGLEKIKTIGDNYMVACGVPHFDPEHPYKIAEMGQKMVRYIQAMKPVEGHIPSMRIGIHSGPLVAGVIGKRKFIYDLWGDAVNTAARMESHGIPNKIHMSADTANIIKDRFAIESRGIMEIKGKGAMETFLLRA